MTEREQMVARLHQAHRIAADPQWAELTEAERDDWLRAADAALAYAAERERAKREWGFALQAECERLVERQKTLEAALAEAITFAERPLHTEPGVTLGDKFRAHADRLRAALAPSPPTTG